MLRFVVKRSTASAAGTGRAVDRSQRGDGPVDRPTRSKAGGDGVARACRPHRPSARSPGYPRSADLKHAFGNKQRIVFPALSHARSSVSARGNGDHRKSDRASDPATQPTTNIRKGR